MKRASALTAGFAGLQVFAGYAPTRGKAFSDEIGFGPLQPDPDGVFDLPEGFSYQIISRHGDEMDDGFRVPHRPDGMATFPGPNGTTLLVSNHEINTGAPVEEEPFRSDGDASISQMPEANRYDPGRSGHGGLGGTTTVLYDPDRQTVRRQLRA